MPRAVLWLTLLAAAVRLVFVCAAAPATRYPDAEEYLQIARHVVAGDGFVTDDGRQFARGPAYPLFLAAHLATFGERETPMRATQALLGALVVPIAWALARRFASANASFLAALYVALDPFLVYFTGLLLVETIYALLVGLSALLLVRLAEKSSFLDAALLGVVAGVASLLHAGHLASLAAVALLWPLLVPGRRRWALLAVYGIAAVTAMFPWIERNAERSGRFLPVTAKLGHDLYDALGPGATGGAASEVVQWPTDLPAGELARDEALKEACLRYVRQDPLRALRLVPVKFVRFWNVVPNYEKFRSPVYLAVGLGASLPLFVFYLIGLFRLLRRNLWLCYRLLLIPGVISTLHLVFEGSVRYRLPIHPILAAVAAMGLDLLPWQRRESRKAP